MICHCYIFTISYLCLKMNISRQKCKKILSSYFSRKRFLGQNCADFELFTLKKTLCTKKRERKTISSIIIIIIIIPSNIRSSDQSFIILICYIIMIICSLLICDLTNRGLGSEGSGRI